MFETIDYETYEDHVATVTINRPEAMNSFNSQMVEDCLLYTSDAADE